MSTTSAALRGRTAAVAAVAVLVTAGSTVVTGSTADAHATAASQQAAHHRRPGGPASTSRPAIVLVHGAWADSGAWEAVVARLVRDRYDVHVFPTPLESLTTDSAALRDYLATIAGPIVVVGHSYGGAVVTDAATGNANVKALVYLDAFAPQEGLPVGAYVDASSAVGGDPATIFDFVGSDPSNPELYVKRTLFRSAFANDLPARLAGILAITQRPIALEALTEPSTTPAWRTIPSWYQVGTRDQVIPAAAQLAMAQTAGSHVVKAATGHLPMISQPATVTRTIETAATAAR
ncbi:Pimeloyl-ACP methyl ester carboxylesterase [Nocardioides terrae]|uniref:Pimeloyl-ACP methyl ester carboxylesterase n=1 Tax=Nocardioides terrae TaxID=574651 RepID=A0A1I1JV21_9ACTN|nr:alpha/beta hydrolase [Nocardioides terrae]SFC49210.1 Pimeloyl-ACP methyl ester carboxylesterase [Nocardioides terrae]